MLLCDYQHLKHNPVLSICFEAANNSVSSLWFYSFEFWNMASANRMTILLVSSQAFFVFWRIAFCYLKMHFKARSKVNVNLIFICKLLNKFRKKSVLGKKFKITNIYEVLFAFLRIIILWTEKHFRDLFFKICPIPTGYNFTAKVVCLYYSDHSTPNVHNSYWKTKRWKCQNIQIRKKTPKKPLKYSLCGSEAEIKNKLKDYSLANELLSLTV